MSRLLVTNKSFELLEPYEGKLSRTVLRGESSRKGADLLDRDLLLAFIQRLKNKEGEISIQVTTPGKQVKLKEWPEMLISEIGYIDPDTEMSIDKIEDYYEDLTAEETND